MKNWKTTVSGLVAAIAGFVAFAPEHFGGDKSFVVNLSRFAVTGGLAGVGIFAKDSPVSPK